MDFSGAIATASATIGLVKSLKELDHNFDKAELMGRIVELHENLADVKGALIDAQEKASESDAEIARLKVLFKRVEELTEVKGFNYSVVDGKVDGMPFCPTCESDGVGLYRIVLLARSYSSPRTCPKCKFNYGRAAVEYTKGKASF